jgi:NDP-sugar pyrophosphorylase family protein
MPSISPEKNSYKTNKNQPPAIFLDKEAFIMEKIKTSELFCRIPKVLTDLFSCAEYPWQILPMIKSYIAKTVEKGLPGYTRYTKNILIAEGAEISDKATLNGPLIIGMGAEIRAGALIRGNAYVGEGAVIGNSTEVKNSIVLDGAKAPHYNYIGDSIVGFAAHLGAGVILSNLRLDKGEIIIKAKEPHVTSLTKVGSFIGDGCEIGCGSVLNPGTVLGRGCSVYPLSSVSGVYCEKSIIGK